MDYDLRPLGTRNFEHMIGALLEAELGIKVGHFGDGPDGGREATYDGPLEGLADQSLDWAGYVVIQAKFKQRPDGTSADQDWLIGEIRKELKTWKGNNSARADRKKQPDYLLIASNVVLTPVAGSGGIDRVHQAISAALQSANIKACHVLHFDKICRMLDAHKGVRSAYAGLITPGDVLSKLSQLLERDAAELEHSTRSLLIRDLTEQRSLRLTDVGGQGTLYLEHTGTDLPASEYPASRETSQTALSLLYSHGDKDHTSSRRDQTLTPEQNGRTALVLGGPGQGKSTITSLCIQGYRLALLGTDPDKSGNKAAKILRDTETTWADQKLPRPAKKRYPIRVSLNEAQSGKPFIKVLRERLIALTDDSPDAPELWEWLSVWPSVILIDGFDEVASETERNRIVSFVEALDQEATTRDLDLTIVLTTRPVSYQGEFSDLSPAAISLVPLSLEAALGFARRFAESMFPDAFSHQGELVSRLRVASGDSNVARLLASPLQVAVMLLLLDEFGEAPNDRFKLFDGYFQTMYKREMVKEGGFGRLLADHRTDIEAIHESAGLLLQCLAEGEGTVRDGLTSSQLADIIRQRLESQGYEEPELGSLTEALVRAALTRLVLLVAHGGDIGFELRSLQEYMAARACTSGSDSEVIQALTAMAPSAYWRNVWTLSFSRTMQRREYLQPDLNQLLEHPGDDLLAERLGLHVELACALAMDGCGVKVPLFRRGLTTLVCKYFDYPPLPFDGAEALDTLAAERPQNKTLILSALDKASRSGSKSVRSSLITVTKRLLSLNGVLAGPARELDRRVPMSDEELSTVLEIRRQTSVPARLFEGHGAPLSQFLSAPSIGGEEGLELPAAVREWSEAARVATSGPDGKTVVGGVAPQAHTLSYPEAEDARQAVCVALEVVPDVSWGARLFLADALWGRLRQAPVGEELCRITGQLADLNETSARANAPGGRPITSVSGS